MIADGCRSREMNALAGKTQAKHFIGRKLRFSFSLNGAVEMESGRQLRPTVHTVDGGLVGLYDLGDCVAVVRVLRARLHRERPFSMARYRTITKKKLSKN